MGEVLILRKVTIDGIGHYVDPFLEDGDRTWCGEPVYPFVFPGWQPKAQECQNCIDKKEKESAARQS